MTQKEYSYIDLFAGCGGLSLGLHNAGWKGLFAVEKNKDAFLTLKHNLIDKKKHFDWPDWLPLANFDIDYLLKTYDSELRALRDKVDLISGGPPCQGFSSAGRRREDDVRNGLIKSYLRFIMHVRPKMIFFENVQGFTIKFEKNKSKGILYSNYVLRVLRFFGYDVEGQMTDFSKFGIPQKRSRFILIGIRRDVAEKKNIEAKLFFEFISRNKYDFLRGKKLPIGSNLGNAISDLLKRNGTVLTPDRKGFLSGVYSTPKSKYQKYVRSECLLDCPDSHSFVNHTKEIEQRFIYFLKHQKANGNISDKSRKKFKLTKHVIITLAAKAKAPTLTTLPDDYIHYCEPRVLTVREYARIQSFPDWFEFKGRYTTGGKQRTHEVPRYTQIGNAIPPLFGEQCGIAIKTMIENE